MLSAMPLRRALVVGPMRVEEALALLVAETPRVRATAGAWHGEILSFTVGTSDAYGGLSCERL